VGQQAGLGAPYASARSFVSAAPNLPIKQQLGIYRFVKTVRNLKRMGEKKVWFSLAKLEDTIESFDWKINKV
jgi:hypothetical protein